MFRALLLVLIVDSTVWLGCSGGNSPDAVDAELDAARDTQDSDVDAPDPVFDGGAEPGWGVLSLNLHCFRPEGTRFTNEERFRVIADRVLERNVRVLLLQEVCDEGSRNALDMLEALLETLSGREWHSEFAFAHRAWVGMPDEADEGLAILADVPIEDPVIFTHRAEGSLQRVVVSGQLGGALSPLRVASYHLEHRDESVRRVQARELATSGLAFAGSPNVLLGGDLNATETSPPYAPLAEAGFVDVSSELSASRIDHVFVHRGAEFEALEAELLFVEDPVSDHPGVFVRLDRRTPLDLEFTTVDLSVDVGANDSVFIRGDQAPLAWSEGWPATPVDASTWRFATTELSGTFEYKPLRNDTDESVGENLVGQSGITQTAAVLFE